MIPIMMLIETTGYGSVARFGKSKAETYPSYRGEANDWMCKALSIDSSTSSTQRRALSVRDGHSYLIHSLTTGLR